MRRREMETNFFCFLEVSTIDQSGSIWSVWQSREWKKVKDDVKCLYLKIDTKRFGNGGRFVFVIYCLNYARWRRFPIVLFDLRRLFRRDTNLNCDSLLSASGCYVFSTQTLGFSNICFKILIISAVPIQVEEMSRNGVNKIQYNLFRWLLKYSRSSLKFFLVSQNSSLRDTRLTISIVEVTNRFKYKQRNSKIIPEMKFHLIN